MISHASPTAKSLPIQINVGPLNNLPSLHYHLALPLLNFSKEYVSGKNPGLIWDLTNVLPRRQNMATLTAFLSIAHRVRMFTGTAPMALTKWNPQVLSFWNDISLFQLADNYDLIRWQKELIGGFPVGISNPNTSIIDFPFLEPPNYSNINAWKQWKDDIRENVKSTLLLKCGKLFSETRYSGYFPHRLKDYIAIASAELVVNSLIHGRSTAFIGLQRTSRGISVAVCDCGDGFVRSLTKGDRRWSKLNNMSDIEAIFIGSVENTREMGLRRAIDAVVRMNGHVIITSNNAYIRWEHNLWERATESMNRFLENPHEFSTIHNILGPPVTGSLSDEKKHLGYHRIWPEGLRGTRITFEIDFKEYNKVHGN